MQNGGLLWVSSTRNRNTRSEVEEAYNREWMR